MCGRQRDATGLLEEKREEVDRLVRALLEAETVEQNELSALLGAVSEGGDTSPVAAASGARG